MKKYIIITMILVLSLCLGCGKELKSIDVVIYVSSNATDSEILNKKGICYQKNSRKLN